MVEAFPGSCLLKKNKNPPWWNREIATKSIDRRSLIITKREHSALLFLLLQNQLRTPASLGEAKIEIVLTSSLT
uniref:Uncharacterized protein n=1 Tax=Megaselia scalaris TaxID=36166 RepID=T1GMV3_MEGSC